MRILDIGILLVLSLTLAKNVSSQQNGAKEKYICKDDSEDCVIICGPDIIIRHALNASIINTDQIKDYLKIEVSSSLSVYTILLSKYTSCYLKGMERMVPKGDELEKNKIQ